MVPNTAVTRFLNVDLELVAAIELAPLLENLSPTTFALRDSVDDGKRTVWLELGRDPRNLEDAILEFAGLIESLPGSIRALWDGCEDRCVNVGIQGGIAPHASAFQISPAAISKLAAISARLEITVYAADGGG